MNIEVRIVRDVLVSASYGFYAILVWLSFTVEFYAEVPCIVPI